MKPLTARESSSAVVRVLEALRRFFRVNGYSPSYREIHVLASVPVSRIRSYLDQLQATGYLRHQRELPRSIVLVDRFANASDAELEQACHGRNWTIVKPPPAAAALGEAYPVMRTDCIADIEELLWQLE